MESFSRLIASGSITVDRWPVRTSSFIQRLDRTLRTVGFAALVAFALTVQGCSDTSSQTAGPVYPGPEEYAAYGYSYDPYATYNPFFYGYYSSLPYYYYPHFGGDGDHDCDDGFCGPHGGSKPHLPMTVGSLPHRLPPPNGAALSQRSVLTAQSTEPTGSINPRGLSAQDSHAASFPPSGFGGGGFHSGGFGGGGFHGSSHR